MNDAKYVLLATKTIKYQNMTLILSVKYHTYWGESIGVVFDGEDYIHPLTYVDADNWQIEINCPDKYCFA